MVANPERKQNRQEDDTLEEAKIYNFPESNSQAEEPEDTAERMKVVFKGYELDDIQDEMSEMRKHEEAEAKRRHIQALKESEFRERNAAKDARLKLGEIARERDEKEIKKLMKEIENNPDWKLTPVNLQMINEMTDEEFQKFKLKRGIETVALGRVQKEKRVKKQEKVADPIQTKDRRAMDHDSQDVGPLKRGMQRLIRILTRR